MATILVADDAPAILDVLDDVLTAAGHRVVRAASGAEALEKFQTTRPDLAVIDVMLPDIDGLVVLEALRRIDGNTPVIVITGMMAETLTTQIQNRHAVSFFQKGSGLDVFVALVNKTLGLSRAGGR